MNLLSKTLRSNKRMLIIFPIYILYIIMFELILGMGKDIWDDLTRKNNG